MRLVVLVLLSIASTCSLATDHWQWSEKVAVGSAHKTGVFHHLDGSGRQHIAVSRDSLAVVWEDDSSASPQIYLAEKSLVKKQFNQAVRLSSGSEAYEPSLVSLGNSGFVTAYEEDGAIYIRLLSEKGMATAIKLSTAKASHASSASVTSQGNNVFVIWREKYAHTYRLLVAGLVLDNNQLVVGDLHPVETEALATPVLKPVITTAGSMIFVAWEDRREGHTRLLYSYANTPELRFSKPENLNEFFSGRNQYDKGSGVTRISLARFGEDEFLAAWMDKRRGGKGYGIFAAIGSADDKSFGPNEKVHGDNGDQQPHYNPSVSGNTAGDFIVAWDDFRTGDLDIWLSSYNDNDEWSEDYSPRVASGAGEQSHASIAMDDQGGLHLVWISRDNTSSPTRLWYSYGAVD